MRIACVQCDVKFGDPVANAESAADRLVALKRQGVELAVFPEAYLTGYCVECQADADALAISVDDESLKTLERASEQNDILVIAGFAERDPSGIYNSAVLFEPGKSPRYYRKSHLPDLGLDKFVKPGNLLSVFDTRIGKIGILICFDMRAPEATRDLALNGADVVVLPTNWPVGAEVSADYISIARAGENRIFMATCNRVGEENGFRFIGRSKIIHPTGRVLASAGEEAETIIADLDFADARQKRMIAIPGKYETDVFASRRPDLYAPIIEPIS